MRLPRSKVYRAFPELDRFSEEQCERFMGVLRTGLVRRVWRIAVQVAAALTATTLVYVAVLGAVAGAEALGWNVHIPRSEPGWYTFCVLFLLATLGTGAAAWLFTKDRLVRRQIRRVIRTRGSCAACGYVLAGLPVASSMAVKCPECAFEVMVDPALGEVVTDGAGAPRFLPSPDIVPAFKRWLTPRRRKMLLRAGVGACVMLVVLAGLGWGGYEWFLRRQAAAARADRTGFAGLIEQIEKHQPAGTTPDSPDAWVALEAASKEMARIDIQVTREGGVEYPADVRPENSFDFLCRSDESSGKSDEAAAKEAMNRDLARNLLDAYRRAGVFRILDDMTTRRRAARPLEDPGPGSSLMELQPRESRTPRRMSRMNAARMKLAIDAHELSEFTSALEVNLAMVRMLRQSPLIFDHAAAMSVEWATHKCIKDFLRRRPEVPWVDSIREAMQRQEGGITLVELVECDKLTTLDDAAWLFSDPRRVRGGRFAPEIKAMVELRRAPDNPLGSYFETRAAIVSHFQSLSEAVAAEPFERARSNYIQESELTMVNVLCGSFPALIASLDRRTLETRGLLVWLALEKFRGIHGTYPEALDVLVPSCLNDMPRDPYSGRAFCYRRVENGDGGSFLLYSVAADGIDNGGKPSNDEYEALQPGVIGFDYILGPTNVTPAR